MARLTQSQAFVLFWFQVRLSDGCWEWQGRKNLKGYGLASYQNKSQLTHRIVWIMAHGSVPAGKHVCHHCDNPSCVRIDHLFVGTHADNMRDMHNKGRSGNRRVLTEDQVREIRKIGKRGRYSHGQIAVRFGVSRPLVQKVIARTSYAWVD